MCILLDIFHKCLLLGLQNSGNFQAWKLSMGINGNICELTGINRKKMEVCKIAGTGNLNVVEKNILQHNLG